MKFAAPYQNTDNLISRDDIDEFNLIFTETSEYDNLKNFINIYPDKRINLELPENNCDINKIIELCQEYETLYLRLQPKDLKYLQLIDDEAINYFFDSTIRVYSYGTLEWVFMYNPTDIYISDDLTYNMEEVYAQCQSHNINLRIVLNRISSLNTAVLACPSAQIYRPQDFDFLDRYYDVGEFDFGEEPYDWVKAEVLYRRWFIDHYWDDTLNYMNFDIHAPYPSVLIPSELVHLRANCKHRCTMSVNNSCNKCARLLKMSFVNSDFSLRTGKEYKIPTLETMIDAIIESKDNNENL